MRRLWPLMVLVACAPIPVERAERECLATARGATGPHGTVGIGVGTGGPKAVLDVTISSDYLQGRDPAEVFNRCVVQKSGQRPTRPLYDYPDWKG